MPTAHTREMPALPSSWTEGGAHFSTLTTTVDEIAVEDVRIRARGVAAAGQSAWLRTLDEMATAEIAAAE